jgi:hypothetical protein
MEMQITPVVQNNVTPQTAPVDQIQEKQPDKPPQTQQKDTVILSQEAKDMAAQASGKTVQEEARESAAVKAQEEQTKPVPGQSQIGQ